METVVTKDPKNKFINVEKIKELCRDKDISFAELGRRIGLSDRELISRRLQNLYQISGDELLLIANEFGIPVEELSVL